MTDGVILIGLGALLFPFWARGVFRVFFLEKESHYQRISRDMLGFAPQPPKEEAP